MANDQPKSVISEDGLRDGLSHVMDTAPVMQAMRRRNLYVREEDREIWEKAEGMAGDSLSSLVAGLLRRWVEQREAAKERIVVEIRDRDNNISRKAFRGRQLVSDFQSDANDADRGNLYWAAQGAKGGLALWITDKYGEEVRGFFTYKTFEETTGDDWPADFLSAVSTALGEEWAEEIEL